MILLDKKHYHLLIKLLEKIDFNHLFALSVLEKKVAGRVYVDQVLNPQTFYIVHRYGMSLLGGNCNHALFNKYFKSYALNIPAVRNRHEWMQVYPAEWNTKLQDLFQDLMIPVANNKPDSKKGIIELNTRVNFKFEKDKYLQFKKEHIISQHRIIRSERNVFHDMKGSVVPSNFWDNADDFINNAIGFSLYYENQLASTAFASFLNDNQLELGMETLPQFRGKGFAQYVCSSLIDYCLENNFEPVWACSLKNIGSYRLAKKLGFDPIKEFPYYRLSN